MSEGSALRMATHLSTVSFMDSHVTRLEPTPEGALIRRTREAATPKLTIRAAAARIGMSPEQWGYAERGYTPGRDGGAPQPFNPPAATLARMARSLQVPARALGDAGRNDAAELLDYSLTRSPAQSAAEALAAFQCEHGLTDLEMLQAVTTWQGTILEHMLSADEE